MSGARQISVDGIQVCPQAGRSSFSYAFTLLPGPKRRAIKTLYEFCRTIDDIVDEPTAGRDPVKELDWWRQEVENCYAGRPTTHLSRQLTEIIDRYHLPRERFHEVISGVALDLFRTRYSSFKELEEYCYLVASAVGLLCIEIFGFVSPRSRDYAIRLGFALQFTNILRDLGEDARRGRIYLPLEDLAQFGYSEIELLGHKYNQSFTALMRFECSRLHQAFAESSELLPAEDRRNLVAAEIMRELYAALLRQIESHNYNVFAARVRLPHHQRLGIALRTWLRTQSPLRTAAKGAAVNASGEIQRGEHGD